MPEEIEATTSAQVQEFLNKHKVAVVDCYAEWCGPCKRIAPYLHKKCQEQGVGLIKVNVDTAGELSGAYNITSMPTFLVVKEKWNNVVHRKSGGSEGIVDEMIAKAKSV